MKYGIWFHYIGKGKKVKKKIHRVEKLSRNELKKSHKYAMIKKKFAGGDDSSMPETKKKLIIFSDIGDTVIDEGTEVRNENLKVSSPFWEWDALLQNGYTAWAWPEYTFQ